MFRLDSAEAVSRRRGRVVLLFAATLAVYTVLLCMIVANHEPIGVDQEGPSYGLLYIVIWAIWVVNLALWVFATPGLWRWNASERAVLNDELVRHHRSLGTFVAFAVLALGVIVQVLSLWLWRLPEWWPIASLSCAVIAGSVVFGMLDVRANG